MNQKTAPTGLLRRLVGAPGDRQRGFAEAGVAVTGAALVLGAALGSGVASTIVSMSDGVTWLPDEETGQVVQVNPATGRAERRLQVAEPGSELAISQGDGRLVVTDLGSGTATTIDLATLLAGGQRRTEETARVLVGGGQMYLVSVGAGVVRAVDPLTLKDLGSPYRSATALADAVVDARGTVWVVTTEGDVRSVTWKPTGKRFEVGEPRPVRGAGRGTRLLPHDRGVTVFAPDGGAIVQVGVGRELAVAVPALKGEVLPAAQAPVDLAPAAVPARSAVVMLSGDRLLEIGVGGLGCTRPGRPAVFTGLVFVPCTGAGRVLVLNPDGTRARGDVVVPAGRDPQLLVDDGRLVVHTEDGSRAVVVEADGATRVIDTGRDGAAVHDPRNAASAPVAAPAQRPSQPGAGKGGPAGRKEEPQQPREEQARHEPPQPQPEQPAAPAPPTVAPGDRPTTGTPRPRPTGVTRPPAGPGRPGSSSGPSSRPTSSARPTDSPADAPDAPTRVDTRLGEAGLSGQQVHVTWRGVTPAPDSYAVHAVVLDVDDEDGSTAVTPPSVEVEGTETAATLEVACGARYRFTVEAVVDGVRSAPAMGSAVRVPTCAGARPPMPPTNVTAVANLDGVVTVLWDESPSEVDGYLVGPVGGSTTSAPAHATSVVLRDVPPGEGVSFVVEAVRGDLRAASEPSSPVRVAGPPGMVTFGEVRESWSGQVYSFGISWDVPTANGSPVLSYEVVWQTPTTVGNVVSTSPQLDVPVDCSSARTCAQGGTVSVTVAARNSAGVGPTSTYVHRFSGPAGPADGDSVVESVRAGVPDKGDKAVPMYVTVSPPAAWAAHTGTCALSVTRVTAGGASSTAAPRTIPCAGGEFLAGAYDDGGGGTVSVSVRATYPGQGHVDSAPVTADVPERRTWAWCDSATGICVEPAGLTDPDVNELPRELVGQPRLDPGRASQAVAGTFLLLGAGALRALRRRSRPDIVHVLTPMEERPG